jgi:hypothetical protein
LSRIRVLPEFEQEGPRVLLEVFVIGDLNTVAKEHLLISDSPISDKDRK